MLHSTAGLDSLLLVVSPFSPPPSTTVSTSNGELPRRFEPPSAPSEVSWIGGTELGKEFWMGLKGGGVNGAKAFRMKCQMRHEAELHAHDPDDSTSMTAPPFPQPGLASLADPAETRTNKAKSGDVKTELNAAMRQALRYANFPLFLAVTSHAHRELSLRSVSGNPAAEMRWTKPTSLEDSYDVRLVGWPQNVEVRNPSNNSVKDNRMLLDLVRSGRMKLVKRGSREWDLVGSATRQMVHAPSEAKLPPGAWPTDGNTLAHVAWNTQADGARRAPAVHAEPSDIIQGSSRGHVSPLKDVSRFLDTEAATESHILHRELPVSVPSVSPQSMEDNSRQRLDASERALPKRSAESNNEGLEELGRRHVKRVKTMLEIEQDSDRERTNLT
jgi:hypothetical protein